MLALAGNTFDAFLAGTEDLAMTLGPLALEAAAFLSGTALALPLASFALGAVLVFLLEVFTSCLLAVWKVRAQPRATGPSRVEKPVRLNSNPSH